MGLIAGGLLLTAAGGAASAYGTAESQNDANKASAKQAALQTETGFYNYLASNGLNLQSLVAKHPELTTEYNRVKSQFPGVSFETWLYRGIKGNPSDPLWNEINNPSGDTARNTTMPGYVTLNGAAAQPQLANLLTQAFQDAQGGTTPNNVAAFLAANPSYSTMIQGEIDRLKSINDPGANRSPQQWLVDTLADEAAQGGGGFTTAFNQYSAEQKANQPASPQQAGQDSATSLVNDLLSGATLQGNLGLLQPALDARTAQAGLVQQGIDEQRSNNTNIRDVQLTGLADLLGVRETGAGDIYDMGVANAGTLRDAQVTGAEGIDAATLEGLTKLLNQRQGAAQDIFNAQETGARGIYDAQLLGADAYSQAAEQALQRVLAEQQANRARQGFVGTSSGSDLTRGRLMANSLQTSAQQRTAAGVDLQKLLAQAGVGRATTLGGAGEQDAMGRLQSGVTLAQALANAGIGYAGNVGNAGMTREQMLAAAREQAASGRMNANTQLATSNASLLDTNADMARKQAEFDNAMDILNMTLQGQNTQLGAIGAPAGLAQSQVAIQSAENSKKYGDITALLQALQPFASVAQQPGLVSPNIQPVMNGWQVGGGAASSIGSALTSWGMMKAAAGAGGGGGNTAQPPSTAGGNYMFSGASAPGLLQQSSGSYSPGFAQTPLFTMPTG